MQAQKDHEKQDRAADLLSIMALCRTVIACRTASAEQRVRAREALERCSRELDRLQGVRA